MAASEDDDHAASVRGSECIIHVVRSVKGKAKPFSETTWNKVKSCAEKWMNLDGEYAEIAREVVARAGHDNVAPTEAGFHRECYARFTDIAKIRHASQ